MKLATPVTVFKSSKQKGAYSVELALSLFVLLVFVMVFWEFVSAFVVHQRVTYASFMAERAKVVGGNPYAVGEQLKGGEMQVTANGTIARERLDFPVDLTQPWSGNRMQFIVEREVSMPQEPHDFGDNAWGVSNVNFGAFDPAQNDVAVLNSDSAIEESDDVSTSFSSSGSVIVDNTAQALYHYYNGNGEPVELGPETRKAIMNSPTHLEKAKKIREGRSTSKTGHYGVNMEREVYHVGDTPIYYEQTCSGATCTTVFTSKGDGFWDPVYSADGKGPNGEFGGTPFEYKPFQWEETYPNPYLDE